MIETDKYIQKFTKKLRKDFVKKGYLNPNEEIEVVIPNSTIRKSFIVLINQRLVIWGGYLKAPGQQKITRKEKSLTQNIFRDLRSIPYNNIQGVSHRAGIINADFEVNDGTTTYFIDTMNKKHARLAVLAIEEKRKQLSKPISLSSSTQSDIPGQLKNLKELLDSGILTTEEYEEKRKKLVDQL